VPECPAELSDAGGLFANSPTTDKPAGQTIHHCEMKGWADRPMTTILTILVVWFALSITGVTALALLCPYRE
jgi:hypothetical protein